MRRQAVWLVTLPLVLAGIEGAHQVANAAMGAHEDEVFTTAASGRPALVPVAASLAAVLLAALCARACGLWSSSRRSRLLALPFAVVPPVGFVSLELGEALAGSEPLTRRSLFGGAFALGLALQLPVAALGYLVARGLLRLSDEVRARTAGLTPPARAREPRTSLPRDEVFHAAFPAAGRRGRAPPPALARPG